MNRRDLEELVAISEWPCVSVLVPLEKKAPDSRKNSIAAKSALGAVQEKLARELPDAEWKPVFSHLEALLDGLELFDIGRRGLALFASPTYASRFELDFPVRERISVDRVFATRQLVVAFSLGFRWRAILLAPGAGRARLLQGFKEELREVGALTDEPLPTILVGDDADRLSFLRHSTDAKDVIAQARGRHEHDPPDALGPLLWPIVLREIDARRRAFLERELDSAIKKKLLVSGIEEVWRAAHEGKGALLLVEEDFQFPIEAGSGVRPLSRAPAGVEAENAIDEMVDVVIGLGGRVQFVPPGSLREHGGIALVLRYADARAA